MNVRVAALSDLHYGRRSKGQLTATLTQASEMADVLLLCGDLTDHGLPEEAEILANDLQERVRIPVLAVLGNHDFEAGRPEEVREIIEQAGATVMDGTYTVINGVGFAGVTGFGGGFDRWMLHAWGEPLMKEFVQMAVSESLKLEQALSRLQTKRRVVLLHYSPIRETVEGEPLEIFPFLGSSRLEDPLNRFDVTAVFHGHAHKGAPEGRTAAGVPVYNVSIPVLLQVNPEHPPFRLIEIAGIEEETTSG